MLAVLALSFLAGVSAADTPFVASLSGALEVPPSGSTATGFGRVTLNGAETQITVSLQFAGLGSNQTAAHIHGPAAPGANGPVVFTIGSVGTPSGTFTALTFAATPTQVANLKAGLLYFNVHSAGLPGGEIRGQIFRDTPFEALLTSDEEVPTNASTAVGFGRVSLNQAETSMYVSLRYDNLTAAQTAAHIHGAAAVGSNGPAIFSLGAPGGTSGQIVDALFAPTAQQVADLKAGLHYFNVHSTSLPGGEIRGQILRAPFDAPLSGTQEAPPNASTATGFGRAALNATETRIAVSVRYDALTSALTAAHIHGPAAPGSTGPVLCTLGLSGGTAGFGDNLVCPATAGVAGDLKAGLLYVNVHSSTFPGGEIRGQLDMVFRNGFE
ncbi:MAG TPA: CHRD domain-containing protein [Vicinamibacteria bacterium]|nr:CHRD domain-containing protein [Vicinamibacteria bacterium]